MKWEIQYENNGCLLGFGREEGESIEDCVSELARFFYSKILPLHEVSEWPFIIVEVWPDSGRLIVYPRREGTGKRDEKGICQLMIPQLLAKYEALANLPASKFDDQYFDMMQELVMMISDRWKVVHNEVSLSGTLDLRINDSGKADWDGNLVFKLLARL